MSLLRSRPLLVAIFLLTIVLQMLMPFLHAHTGVSRQSGLHPHVVSAGFQTAIAPNADKVFFTNATEESSEVGVPVSRQSDQFKLLILNFYVLILFALVYAARGVNQSYSFCSVDRFAYQRYTQSSPPLSLAPPQRL